MNYTEQLEFEAQQRRHNLSASLDELRERLSPGQVVDQLVDYVQEGSGGQFFHNLKRQVVGNPLPVTLIGAGVAWLVLARGRASHNGDGRLPHRHKRHSPRSGAMNANVRRAVGNATDSIDEMRSEMSDKMRATASDLSDTATETAATARARLAEGRARLEDTVQSAVSSVRETAGDTYTDVYDAATGAYEQVSARASRTASAMADSIRNLGRGTAHTGQSIAEFCREQPLVVAGIGLALGAALGAALPATDLEDRMMGDASEEAKRKVREIASDTVDKVQVVGERAVDAARDAAYAEAGEQGFIDAEAEAAGPDEAADVLPEQSAAGPVDDGPEPAEIVTPEPDRAPRELQGETRS
jgi:hypothetical protein